VRWQPSVQHTHGPGLRLLRGVSRRNGSDRYSLVPARQNSDDALVALRHVGVFSIGDGVAHSHFYNMRAGCDLEFLRPVEDFLRLTGLHPVDEYNRTDRRAGDDQFGRLG